MLSGTNFLLLLFCSYSEQRGRSDRPAARQPRARQPSLDLGSRCRLTARDEHGFEESLTHHHKNTLCSIIIYIVLLSLGPWDHGTMGPWDHGSMGCILVHP